MPSSLAKSFSSFSTSCVDVYMIFLSVNVPVQLCRSAVLWKKITCLTSAQIISIKFDCLNQFSLCLLRQLCNADWPPPKKKRTTPPNKKSPPPITIKTTIIIIKNNQKNQQQKNTTNQKTLMQDSGTSSWSNFWNAVGWASVIRFKALSTLLL